MNLSLGAAVYYDRDLSTDPSPLRSLWKQVASSVPAAQLVQWTGTAKRVGKKQPLDLADLEATVASGDAASAAIEVERELLVLSHATSAATLPEPLVPRAWKYDTAIAMSARLLASVGVQPVIDAIVAFGDAVAVKAGVIFWADSMPYAGAFATGGLTTGMTAEQERSVRDSHDLSNQWGRVIRGPAWGTFLGAEHVAKLGDLTALPAAKRLPLASGGVYVQLTALGEETALDVASPALDKLRAALAPVL